MRILDRYIVREVFRHAFLGLVVFTFVFFVPQLVRLMELLVRHAGSTSRIFLLLLCTLPGVLTFTIPMAVLVGVLLGLGRMSADSELIALTAVGISRRRVLLPVGVLALTGMLLTLAMTLWISPRALRAFRGIEAELAASQASFQVQPRVFDERYPKLVFYVNDVSPSGAQWRGVLLAESGGENGSRLTLAEEAFVTNEPRRGKLELHLRGGTTHEYSLKEPDRYSVTNFGDSDWPLEFAGLAPAATHALTAAERNTTELLADRGPGWLESRVEFHRRLAFPFASLVFALVAVPFGARPRRGGRAAGFLLAVALIASYYLLFIVGAGMARQGNLSPAQGIWAANAFLALLGLFLLPRMEQFRGENRVARYLDRVLAWNRLRRRRARARAAARAGNGAAAAREPAKRTGGMFPRLMDLYVLRRFFFYLAVIMGVFIFLFEAFTFFELLDDIARHRAPFLVVVDYFRYLTPYLVYQLTPLAALVAVLVTLGLMSKNNEIVACKAIGISLYRLALPLVICGVVLAGAMLALDDTYLPYATQRQDSLRNQIKGKPPQTFRHPRRQWIFGENSKIYNYQLFDPDRKFFGELNVVEIDPATFQIRRRIYAARAHWEESDKRWVLESGWVRDFSNGGVTRFDPFGATEFAELTEPPSYFDREVRQAFQMSWRELSSYIKDLHQAGFDVATLTVQWHRKLAYPLMVPVSMGLAIPFAFLVGARGAIGGVALGVAIAIVYWSAAALLQALGGVGQLPPLIAGWSPDLVFFFLGLYFFLKMPT
jgi:LPS export ABC transporter permease LptF/LPS export ABC transporter permease LptG